MATKNPQDMMASVATSMQQRTGKTLEEWVKAVEPCSKTKLTLGLRFKTAPTSPLLEEGKGPRAVHSSHRFHPRRTNQP